MTLLYKKEQEDKNKIFGEKLTKNEKQKSGGMTR